ncbi:MAG: hypothetical protein ACR2FY_15025 [Pirellulaceae bacterium]
MTPLLPRILASIDVLLSPVRGDLPAKACKAIQNARRRYGRRGIDWKGDTAELRRLERDGKLIVFRSSSRRSVLLPPQVEADVRQQCGLPSLAEAMEAIVDRFGDTWRSEIALARSHEPHDLFLLEHKLAPAITTNALLTDFRYGCVHYRRWLDDPTQLASSAPYDEEASEAYRTAFLRGLRQRRFLPF